MFEARCHGDLIFLLPPEAATVVDSVRARFDPSFGLLPAHLSLLYPLETLSSLALSRIAAAIAREKPLKIDLKGWGFFPAPFWTIYASVENPAPLNAIRLRLLTALAGEAGEAARRPDFLPHVTVGVLSGETAFGRAWAEIACLPLRISLLLRELSLARCSGEQEWHVEHRFSLRA